MVRCENVIMCHMFMGGTLVACRTLQKALLERFVVFFFCSWTQIIAARQVMMKVFLSIWLDFQRLVQP